MAWMTGTTTWGNLDTDLAKLICGEMAAGNAVTAGVGDAWLRESGTPGVGATIRSPASKDVSTGNIKNRCGYFSAHGVLSGGSGALPQTSVAKVTAGPITMPTSPASLNNALLMSLRVITTNTVSGNYSTALIQITTRDPDNPVTDWDFSDLSPNAAGTLTIRGLTLNFSDPSGFLQLNACWVREFTSTYPYGIDWWPMYYRKSAAATFSVAPPGVSGTDYALVETPHVWGNNDTHGENNSYYFRGGFGYGLGIKTATGLGANPQYTCSFPMALHKLRIYKNPTTAGVLNLDYGQSLADYAGAVQVVGGFRFTNWLQMFQTPGSVTTGAQVQYWLSVAADGIIIVLNGDPGFTGKMGANLVGVFTPYDTTYDVFPVYTGPSSRSYLTDWQPVWDLWSQYARSALAERQNGSEGTRDWQTLWMRSDMALDPNADLDTTNFCGSYYSDMALGAYRNPLYVLGMDEDMLSSIYNSATVPARSQKPNPVDSKWWLYGCQVADMQMSADRTNNLVPDRILRGQLNTRVFFIPGDFWGNGDELTDTGYPGDGGPAAKYLLVTPDYTPLYRARSDSNTYVGGLAIAEI